jgi:hypothetical protein
MAAIRAKGDDPAEKYTEYNFETLVSLFLYGFFGIGLIMGLVTFAFQRAQGNE